MHSKLFNFGGILTTANESMWSQISIEDLKFTSDMSTKNMTGASNPLHHKLLHFTDRYYLKALVGIPPQDVLMELTFLVDYPQLFVPSISHQSKGHD